jgi:hypothetical protein
VYVLVFESDVTNGRVHLYWNTLAGLDYCYLTMEQYSDINYTKEDIKYSTGDHRFNDDYIGLEDGNLGNSLAN